MKGEFIICLENWWGCRCKNDDTNYIKQICIVGVRMRVWIMLSKVVVVDVGMRGQISLNR